jgi:hypothetical protein
MAVKIMIVVMGQRLGAEVRRLMEVTVPTVVVEMI